MWWPPQSRDSGFFLWAVACSDKTPMLNHLDAKIVRAIIDETSDKKSGPKLDFQSALY